MVRRATVRRVGAPRVMGATVLGAAALLGISGCGTAAQAGAAAVVNDHVISDQAVQKAAAELSQGTQDGQSFSPSEVVTGLVIGQFALPEAAKLGKGVSADMAKSYLPKLTDPSPEALDYVRTVVAIRNLDANAQRSLVQQMKDASISVNPRYGTFDPGAFDSNGSPLVPESRNWLKPTANPTTAPAPAPEGGATPAPTTAP